MAEDKVEPREATPSQRLPWVSIFQGFRIALDFNKLLLAAAGIIVMAFGWWLLAAIFNYDEPTDPNKWATDSRVTRVEGGDPEKKKALWAAFKADHDKWALLYKQTGNPADNKKLNAADFADSKDEWDRLKELEKTPLTDQKVADAEKEYPGFRKKLEKIQAGIPREAGLMRTWPWSEDRGANPYLLATGQTKSWQGGGFWDWLLRKQIPVLLEPLVKLLQPIVLFFNSKAGPLISFYA